MANVCLFSSQYQEIPLLNMLSLGLLLGCTYIDLSVLKPLLQIFVDGFIRDLTYQREIRNPHLLLFCGIESGLLDIWFAAARCPSSSASILGFLRLLALRSSTDTLIQQQISNLNKGERQYVGRSLTILESSPGHRHCFRMRPDQGCEMQESRLRDSHVQ
jgi:hypothetical protein